MKANQGALIGCQNKTQLRRFWCRKTKDESRDVIERAHYVRL